MAFILLKAESGPIPIPMVILPIRRWLQRIDYCQERLEDTVTIIVLAVLWSKAAQGTK